MWVETKQTEAVRAVGGCEREGAHRCKQGHRTQVTEECKDRSRARDSKKCIPVLRAPSCCSTRVSRLAAEPHSQGRAGHHNKQGAWCEGII